MLQSKCHFYINCQYHTDIIKSVKIVTHDAAVFFIIHFLHLQAVRLKDTKNLSCYSTYRLTVNFSKRSVSTAGLTRYSNFTSRYLRMVSLVSGMALLRYVFRSWSICTTRDTLKSNNHWKTDILHNKFHSDRFKEHNIKYTQTEFSKAFFKMNVFNWCVHF